MSTIKEMIQERISACEAEIAECKRALAAMEPQPDEVIYEKIGPVSFGGSGASGIDGKRTLADIITEILKVHGPAMRTDLIPQVQAIRPDTNAQTISGTLNGMSKSGIVKLRNKKWSLIKP